MSWDRLSANVPRVGDDRRDALARFLVDRVRREGRLTTTREGDALIVAVPGFAGAVEVYDCDVRRTAEFAPALEAVPA